MNRCPNCLRESESFDVACIACPFIFDRRQQPYSQEDKAAFDRNDGKHFGFPYNNVFATVVDSAGNAKFTQAQAMTQLLGVRFFKRQDSNCWIWGERFVFDEKQIPRNIDNRDYSNPTAGYASFLDKFDYEKRVQIKELAECHNLDPATKTHGKPDLAIYSPLGPIEWRFAELKRKDKLDDRQVLWLNLLSQVLGPGALFVLEFKGPSGI